MRIAPIAPGRYLLGHAVPAGQWVEVLQRALHTQFELLRKRRCGATQRPRKGVASKRANARHIVPRARGGQSTVENLRLLCHAHNQHAAEREFGRSHVEEKREAAKQRRAAERYHREKDRERTEQRKAEIARQREDLGEAFRMLGYRGRDFELALAYCASKADAPPEERLKYALGCLAPRAHREHPSNVAPPACAEARP